MWHDTEQFANQNQQPERDAICPDVDNMTTVFHVEHQSLSDETLEQRIERLKLAILNEVFDRR